MCHLGWWSTPPKRSLRPRARSTTSFRSRPPVNAAVSTRFGEHLEAACDLTSDGVPDVFTPTVKDVDGVEDAGTVMLISGATGQAVYEVTSPEVQERQVRLLQAPRVPRTSPRSRGSPSTRPAFAAARAMSRCSPVWISAEWCSPPGPTSQRLRALRRRSGRSRRGGRPGRRGLSGHERELPDRRLCVGYACVEPLIGSRFPRQTT